MQLTQTGLPVLANEHYQCRLARCSREVIQAQCLRYEVFNLELNEGLASSHANFRDQDLYDTVCDHMLLIERQTERVVGTYRLQSGDTAEEGYGYYSEQAFDFAPYESIRPELLELGRACLHPDHRTYGCLTLLWRGILWLARKRGLRYLIGCSSLHTTDIQVGHATYQALTQSHLVTLPLRTQPKFEMQLPVLDWETPSHIRPKLPKLLRCYLSLGAKVCGRPALDEAFGTIDFLTLLDLKNLPERSTQRLFDGRVG